jgi:hypothetical protein
VEGLRGKLLASGALLGGEEFLLLLLPHSLFEFFYLLTLSLSLVATAPSCAI